MRRRLVALALSLSVLTGCDLAPDYERPPLPTPATWPEGAVYPTEGDSAAGLPWHALIGDDRLRRVVDLALADNRDLRAAMAIVESAEASYRATASNEVPALAVGAEGTMMRGGPSGSDQVGPSQAGFIVPTFEIDLFHQLRNQTRQMQEAFLASKAGAQSLKLLIVGKTAAAYLTLAADRDKLRLAQATDDNSQKTLGLTQSLFSAGLTSAAAVQDARALAGQSQSDLASLTTQVAQDRNALELLMGAPLPDSLQPDSLAALDGTIAVVPAGLSSSVLLRRPDVRQAEHDLEGAHAAIGAARAAFFPVITLTSTAGLASSTLTSLFTHGLAAWTLAPTVNMPVIGGAYGANLDEAKAQRDYALANYEKAVQTAFHDVADALATRGTIAAQRRAQQQIVDSAAHSLDLETAAFDVGSNSYLTVLAAQRSAYSSRQGQLSIELSDLYNRVTVYEAIGSDDTL